MFEGDKSVPSNNYNFNLSNKSIIYEEGKFAEAGARIMQ